MLKIMWIYLFFPIAIGAGLAILPFAVMCMVQIPEYIAPFLGFITAIGICATSGFLVMYFTGPRGLWYQPLLSNPSMYMLFCAITLDGIGDTFLNPELFLAILFLVAISYAAGVIGFLIRHKQDWRVADVSGATGLGQSRSQTCARGLNFGSQDSDPQEGVK